MAEKKDVEINSRADTIDMMHPDIRPYPVTPPPPPEEVHKVYAKRKAEEFGKLCEDWFMFDTIFPKPEALATSSPPLHSPSPGPRSSASSRPPETRQGN
jgi:hypothetical protein